MQVTPAGLASIFFNLQLKFKEGFARPSLWWQELATEMPSTTAENRYAWMSRIPKFRKWLGERMVHNVAMNMYSIRNEPFEDTVGIDRYSIEDDQLGGFANIAGAIGEAAALWPQQLIAAALKAGATASVLAWDGQTYFNGSHPVSVIGQVSGTYSNLFTSSALTASTYEAVRTAMSVYKGEDGEMLNILPTHLIVPTALGPTARRIVEAEVVSAVFGANTAAAGVSNVNKGTAKVLEIPELNDDPTTWYLADLSKGIKPLIFQLREAPKFEQLTSPTDPNVFSHNTFLYGGRARGNAGVSLPFLMAKCTA